MLQGGIVLLMVAVDVVRRGASGASSEERDRVVILIVLVTILVVFDDFVLGTCFLVKVLLLIIGDTLESLWSKSMALFIEQTMHI